MALYISDATAALLGGSRPLGFFFYLGSDVPLRLWMGFSDFPVYDNGTFISGFASVDAAGNKYLGLGVLPAMPDLEVLINGLADRVEFGLSGVSDAVVALHDGGTGEGFIGKEVRVGIAPLDDRWQPLSAIISMWNGSADFTSIGQAVVQGYENPVNVITLSCYSGGTGRARPKRNTYSPGPHKLIYPTDRGLDNISTYRVGFQLAWPRF